MGALSASHTCLTAGRDTRRWSRLALTLLPSTLAAAREAASVNAWPLPALGRVLQAPFFGNSIAVRGGAGALAARMLGRRPCDALLQLTQPARIARLSSRSGGVAPRDAAAGPLPRGAARAAHVPSAARRRRC
jgi:hypothetical protein